MKKSQAGFTMIELVIVIVVIGILAAIALPKYIDIQRDARVAKMKALYGSVRTAGALAKARCELDLAGALPGCTAAAGTVNMDGTSVAMINRYPASSATGITVAASIDATPDGIIIAGAAPTITYSPVGASLAATCVLSYTEATSAAALPTPILTAPVITLVTTGC